MRSDWRTTSWWAECFHSRRACCSRWTATATCSGAGGYGLCFVLFSDRVHFIDRAYCYLVISFTKIRVQEEANKRIAKLWVRRRKTTISLTACCTSASASRVRRRAPRATRCSGTTSARPPPASACASALCFLDCTLTVAYMYCILYMYKHNVRCNVGVVCCIWVSDASSTTGSRTSATASWRTRSARSTRTYWCTSAPRTSTPAHLLPSTSAPD